MIEVEKGEKSKTSWVGHGRVEIERENWPWR